MELGVRVSMDLRNFDSGVAGMNRKLKMVDSEFKAASAEAKRYGDSVSHLRTKMDALAQKLDIQKQKVAHYRQEMEKLNAKQQQLRISSETLVGKVQHLEQAYRKSAQTTGKNSQQTQRLKQELDEVRHKYTLNVQSLSRVNAAIEKNVVSLNRAREGEAKLKHQIQQTNQVMEKQSTLLHRVSEKMKATGHSMQNVGATMGLSFMAGATTLGYALKKTISTAADFESAMSRVAALSGASDVELKKLNDTARQLGSTTSFSASQAAEGMQYLAMAGFKTNDIIAAMPGLLDLAAAGQMELGRAADITSNIMSGFGIAATEAGRVADVLAKASTSANTDVSQLGEAMVYLAPVSKSLGWSLEEAIAAVMAMSDAGIQGAQAGAAFSTSMGRLAKPTGEAKDIIDTLNIKLFDQKGTMKSMPNVIRELERATNGMTDQQKSATLTTIFGAEAYKHWSVLIDKSSDALASNTEMLKNSAGTAKEIAEKQLANLKGELVNLNSAIEGASISIGNALIPAISALGSGVKSAVDWFNSLDESTQQMIATGAALTVGAMGLVGVLGLMSVAIGGLLANPVVLAIAGATVAVAGLGMAAVKLSKDIQKANEDSRRFGEDVSEGTKKAAKGYVDLREQAMINLAKLRVTSGEEAEKIVNETVDIFSKMGNKVKEALNKDRMNIQKATADLLGQIPEELKPVVQQIGDTTVKAIDMQLKKIAESEAIVLDGLRKFGGEVSKMPKEFAKQYTQAMGNMDESSRVFVQKMSDMKNYMQTMQDQTGKINADGAKKWSTDINKAYDEAEKSAKKWLKTKEQEMEHQRAAGHMTKEAYDTMVGAAKGAYEEKINIAKTNKADAYKVLVDSLSEEGQMYDLRNQRMVKADINFLGKKDSARKYAMEQNKKFMDNLLTDTENSEKKMLENRERMISTYNQLATNSIKDFVDIIKLGGENATLAAQALAVETAEGFKIDVGDKGIYTVDTFIKGLNSGELSTRDVAVAHMNQLRTIYGTGNFTAEGLKAMESFAEGLKSKEPVEIAKQLGLDLKSETEIDLGPNGKVTAQTFAEGLSNGTYTFDSMYQYFRLQLKSGMKFDLSDEGKKNIDTLKLGMESKAIDVTEAAKLLGLNVESGVQVDLGKAGEFNVQSLLTGLQTGDIKIQTFVEGVKQLLENGAKIDLTQQGTDTSISYSDGLHAGEGPTREAAQQLSHAAQEELDKTDGVNPANQASNQFSSTLSSHVGQALQAGQLLGTGATSGMNTVDGATPGVKGGDAFTNAVLARSGASKTAGQSNATSANRGFAMIDGVSEGGKGGDAFMNAIVARAGASQSAGKTNATSANRGFATIDGHKPGTKGGTDFANSMNNQQGSAKTAGKNVAESGKGGLGSVSANSAGMNFISGFITGMQNNESPLVSAARGLGNMALGAMKRALDIRSPSRRARDEVGEMIGEGVIIGQENKIPALKKAAQRMADASIPTINPKDLSRATRYLGDTYSGSVSDTRRRTGENPNGLGDSVYNRGNIAVTIPIVLEADGRPLARATYQHVTDYQNRAKVRNSAFIG